MSTVLFLSNQDVRVAVGSVNRNKVTVTRVYQAKAPEGSIINGHVIDEAMFRAFLEDFWVQNRLAKKDVILVLGISQAVTQVLQLPKMSNKMLIQYLPREYPANSKCKNPLYSYYIMEQECGKISVVATTLDRSQLDPHIHRFKDMGIRLSSIVTGNVANMLAMNRLSYVKDKPCIVQTIDGMNLTNILYVDGRYFQSNSNRMFGERGTSEFAAEAARSIRTFQQFLKTQQIEDTISAVYLGGEYQKEDVELCRESILRMDGSLTVEKLYEEQGGNLRLAAEENVSFGNFTALMGAFLAPRGKAGLLFQYRRNTELLKKGREMIRYMIPVVSAAAVLAGIAICQSVIWFARVNIVNRQFDYLEEQEVIERGVEYDRVKSENEELKIRINVITRTTESIGSYPVYTSLVKQVVFQCASGVVEVEIRNFDMITGTVLVEASSNDAEGIYRFVGYLEDRMDLFEGVYYDGFQYDQESGLWKASINCYLAGKVTGEETP